MQRHLAASPRPSSTTRSVPSRLLMRCPGRRCTPDSCDHAQPLARKRAFGGGADTTQVEQVLRSPGEPLETGLRTSMEGRFRHDFGNVRVHADTLAAESAAAVNAEAYTVGQELVFARGRFAPSTPSGRRLLAHELAHAVQQSGTGDSSGPIEVVPDDHPSELAARRAEGNLEATGALVSDARAFRRARCWTRPGPSAHPDARGASGSSLRLRSGRDGSAGGCNERSSERLGRLDRGPTRRRALGATKHCVRSRRLGHRGAAQQSLDITRLPASGLRHHGGDTALRGERPSWRRVPLCSRSQLRPFRSDVQAL
jgi:hypothetical protein